MPETPIAPPPFSSRPSAPAPMAAPPPAVALPFAGDLDALPVAEPNLGAALACGAAAALVGAAIWAAVTFATDFQIGWMAVGVGAGVGVAVRRAGHGVEKSFGWVAAGLALLGCIAGNLFATVAYIASFTHVPYFRVLGSLDVASASDLMKATFSPMDLLFYGIAMVEAFKLAVPKGAAPSAATSP